MSWYVYLVRCSRGALYCGISTDIKARIKRHNSGKGSKAVRALGLPVQLIGSIMMGSKSKALIEEARIKKLTHKQKEELIKKHGTLDQFEKAVWKAYDDLLITHSEAVAGIDKYKKELK